MHLPPNTFKFLPLVSRAFANAGFYPEMGCAIAHHESSWDPAAKVLTGPDGNLGGAYGLFQMTLSTARDLGFAGTIDGLLDPYANVEWAVKLSLRNAKVLKTKAPLFIIPAHNCGAGHVKSGTVPKSTTDQYLPAVLGLMDYYRPLCSQYKIPTAAHAL